MAQVLRMPRLSDTMEEGIIGAWHKKVGDTIKVGDILAEVETDKATMDLESFDEGTLLYIAVEKGAVPVDNIIAIIGEKGEDYQALLEEATTSHEEQKDKAEEAVAVDVELKSSPAASANGVSSSTNTQDDRIKASPLAKSMAKASGIPLNQIQGTGEQGRIVKRDVEAAIAKGPSSIPMGIMPSQGDTRTDLSSMRKTIAKRLAQSKFTAPHFYLTMEINMDRCVAARKKINEFLAPEKVSFNDFVVKASAIALRKHPIVNSSWMDDHILTHHEVNIGVAVAVPDGLIVPVVRNTDYKSLSQISNEVKTLAGKAKNKELSLDEMQGNTFTISNLGMFGIDEFTAIINPPDACILAVGAIAQKPIVVNGQLAVGNIMKVTLSCDHRVVDGATGAAFLQTLRSMLEEPSFMLA